MTTYHSVPDCHSKETCPCKDPCIEWYNRARDATRETQQSQHMDDVYCKRGLDNCVFKQPTIGDIFYEAQKLAGEPVEIRLTPTLHGMGISLHSMAREAVVPVGVGTLKLTEGEVANSNLDLAHMVIQRLCDFLKQKRYVVKDRYGLIHTNIYLDETGKTLWKEANIFRRLWACGQTFITNSVEFEVRNVCARGGVQYIIIRKIDEP